MCLLHFVLNFIQAAF